MISLLLFICLRFVLGCYCIFYLLDLINSNLFFNFYLFVTFNINLLLCIIDLFDL